MSDADAVFFATAAEFRRWLARHHHDTPALVLGFYRKGGATRAITYAEALDEALCFGWIDGHVKRLDEERYTRRFSPRKKDSIWSAVNLRKAEVLEAAGKMTDAGRAAWQGRNPSRAGLYSFEQPTESVLAPELAAVLAAEPRAQAFFDAQTPGYRKTATFWVMAAKQPATRARRMATLIASSLAGELAPPFAAGGARPKAVTTPGTEPAAPPAPKVSPRRRTSR